MSAKRLFNEYEAPNPDQPNQKRLKNKTSFASVIREVVMVNFLDNICSSLEPMIRRVVNEEVENGITRYSRSITKSPSFRIQAPKPSTLTLIFSKTLSLPIFTNSKVVDTDNNPLQLFLVESNGDGKIPVVLSYPIKIEIIALDGDLSPEEDYNDEEWNVLKERTGKRPLITGDVNITMRDGIACVGEIAFTDNSSWIRGRKFRVGARVVHGSGYQGVKIHGAMTEAFSVKDHRGELYKKHHPPALRDEVWRLEKIGKDGSYHKKLYEAGIENVQDLLKLFIVDQIKLRKILGMSDKMWEVTMNHARSCVMGNKFYILHGPNYTLTLNPICQVVKAVINGQTYPTRQLTGLNRSYIENWVRDAYSNWTSLEEVDSFVNEGALLTQGDMADQYQDQQQIMMRSIDEDIIANNWMVNNTYLCGPVERGVSYVSGSSSDGDLHY